MAANYTQTEVLNAVAQIFRARIDTSSTGGVRNNREEYQQLIGLASVTFLLYPDSVFYLAQIARNTLLSLTAQEVALIEDMLVALEYMSRSGTPVRDATTLNNARTALLELDNVGSVTNRPETTRFSRSMTRYAQQLSRNVVDQNGDIVRSREEARNILRLDFERLQSLHALLIAAIVNLRDLLSSFVSLNVPTKVSSEAFTNIRKILDVLIVRSATSTDVDNLTKSRSDMLLVLSSKSAVDTIASFSNPGELKYRSPNNPIPPSVKHLGRVTGDGLPAQIVSGLSPWALPISSPLIVSVGGAAGQSVPVDELNQATMPGVNEEPFNLTSLRNLHMTVDATQHTGTLKVASGTTDIFLNEVLPLTFKHLGAPVSVTPLNGGMGELTSDIQLRAIVGFPQLQTFGTSVWNASTSQLTLTVPVVVEDSVTGFRAGHVGYYVQDNSGQKFEILSVDDLAQPIPSVVTIDARGLTPVWGPAAAYTLYGQPIAATQTKFTVAPAFSIARTVGQTATIGPTIKTVKLTAASLTVAQLISSFEAELSDADPNNVGSALNWHVRALVDPGNPKRVAFVPRSSMNPHVSVSALFVKPQVTAVGQATIIQNSCNDILGLSVGSEIKTGFDVTQLLTADELAAMIRENVTGVTVAVEKTPLFSGEQLSTNYGLKTVQATDIDWVARGVQTGNILEIVGGRAAGTYQIAGVSTSTLQLTRSSAFPSSESGLDFRVYSLRVRVSSTATGINSSLMMSGAPELGFSSDRTYGVVPQFEAVTRDGELLSFDRAVVGDNLRLLGDRTLYEITAVSGSQISIDPGLPSNTRGVAFEIQGFAAAKYNAMSSSLSTFTTSPNLLKKNNFDQSLAELDAALTSALAQGQNFASSRGKARQLLAELLSIMTDNPQRADEYSVSVPTASMNLEDILASYSVPVVEPVDNILDALVERRYDRAAALLQGADIREFYNTDEETASYAGNLMSRMRQVNRDLPDPSSVNSDVRVSINFASGQQPVPDAETNFTDTDREFEVDE